jgi:hypothetical protein
MVLQGKSIWENVAGGSVRPKVMAEETGMMVVFHEFVTDCGCVIPLGGQEQRLAIVRAMSQACLFSVSFCLPITFDSSLPTFFFKATSALPNFQYKPSLSGHLYPNPGTPDLYVLDFVDNDDTCSLIIQGSSVISASKTTY